MTIYSSVTKSFSELPSFFLYSSSSHTCDKVSLCKYKLTEKYLKYEFMEALHLMFPKNHMFAMLHKCHTEMRQIYMPTFAR